MNSNPEELGQLLEDWKAHPVTQEVFRLLQDRIQERVDLWLNGNLMSDNATVITANNALAQGYCAACKDILNIEAKELSE
jgi:hypothetical protein